MGDVELQVVYGHPAVWAYIPSSGGGHNNKGGQVMLDCPTHVHLCQLILSVHVGSAGGIPSGQGGGSEQSDSVGGFGTPPPPFSKMLCGGFLRVFFDANTPFLRKFIGWYSFGLHIQSFVFAPNSVTFILSSQPGTAKMQGRSVFALFWAPEKAGVWYPLLILSPFVLGIPENARVK